MRLRLMVAFVLLVAVTLLVASLGSLLLIRRAGATTAEHDLYTQAKFVADLAPSNTRALNEVRSDLRTVKKIGNYRTLTIAPLSASGTFTRGIPPSLAGQNLRPAQLNRSRSVAGTTGDVVYVLIPIELTTLQKASLVPPVPYQDQAVLVATRTVKPSVIGLQWFILVGLASLAAAAIVAYLLANRFSRPLVTAARATQRIAGGDLDTRIPASPQDMAEFAALAAAINTMAEGLARARDQQRQFLLSVSHDLRTPLTSIRGYAEAIVDGTTTDVGGAVQVIATEAHRLERLVQDLLDLARLDARRFSLQPGRVDVSDIVSRAVARFGPPSAAAGIRLTRLSEGGDDLFALCDPDRLFQILSNLLENALRFARTHIGLGARAEKGQVVLWVDDDGAGIAPVDLGRVFDPHVTSDRWGSPGGGTGLGLAIVAELAAAMGGGARAESPVGAHGGTRMVVWVPAVAGTLPPRPGTPSPVADGTTR